MIDVNDKTQFPFNIHQPVFRKTSRDALFFYGIAIGYSVLATADQINKWPAGTILLHVQSEHGTIAYSPVSQWEHLRVRYVERKIINPKVISYSEDHH
jgi:hypothetical protein